ncbi:AcrR family transcriptional regulator [Catenulispora sp. GAS73]|uniref:TetR/AcrR family transcriptional regulator n=1 Tax=Catenulispora sp. GAS73 TaxID=3156269 RepID=UPI0035193EB8
MAATDRPRGRADAQRNRQRLIDVAHRAFTTGDTKVSLEAVAKEAGVGIGTLYRHFPTREALVEAVYLAERGRLCDAADELLAQQPPDQALRTWMDRFADYIATKREMADALRALIADGTVTRSRAREELSTAVRHLLDAGAAAGTLRADVQAEDIVAALVGVVSVCTLPEQREQAGRLMDLLMDGLRRG